MYNRLITTHLAIFSVLCFIVLFQTDRVHADQEAQNGSTYELSDVTADLKNDTLTVKMIGSTPPAYTSRELYDPYRLIIDIADVKIKGGFNLNSVLPQNDFVKMQTTVVKGLKPEITRFIFTIEEGHRQNVVRMGNDLVIQILPVAAAKDGAVSSAQPDGMKEDSTNEKTTDAGSKIRELIEESVKVSDGTAGDETEGASDSLEESFAFSGYKRERISVDFYKIDLHNVFRLFRQISGINLIVDEGVSGTLTLALKDVPWDFALDIILNLMDLKKEERFNTIVIYPSKKEFVWPTRAEDNLDFKADVDVIEQEALVIEKSADQSKEVMQAKDFMMKAQNLETREEFEDAALLYSKAHELWPENTKIANKLATLYLVNLGVNAKALFYAKETLKHDPQNASAALYAAIASANMQRISEAKEYFAQSISNSPPMKEALMSFAAFSENNGQNDAALKLLDKYHSFYGETLDTMVARARILDKLGRSKDATGQYRAILASGFQLRPDLKKYIEGRLTAKDL